jgi:hypothetical protein
VCLFFHVVTLVFDAKLLLFAADEGVRPTMIAREVCCDWQTGFSGFASEFQFSVGGDAGATGRI